MKRHTTLQLITSRCGSRLALATRFACGAVVACAMPLASCTSENYDSGDGANSYLTAELSLVGTSSDCSIGIATLDDGSTIRFSNPFTTDWAQKPDTVYRALIYYDRTTNDVASAPVKARAATSVPVLNSVPASKVPDMHTDALGVESVWLAANGRYANLSLLLKAGKTSGDDVVQTLGLVSDGTTTNADGTRTLRLTLYHDQGRVPEYYTVQRYVSIDSRLFEGVDCVELTVNTYGGVKKYNLLNR